MSQPHPQIILVMSSDFYAGFQQASLDFELEYKPRVVTFDDTHLASIFARIASCNKRSDLWKAGYQAGLFAALYGIAYRWTQETDTYDLHYGVSGTRRAS